MKQFLRPALRLSFLLSLTAASAQAATISQWTFETSLLNSPNSAGPFAPEIGAGSASGYHAGASTYSSPAGNGSAHSFSSNTWAVGDYYQFSLSTSGFTGIQLSWDQTSSNTGPRDFKLAYSTNGTTFTDFTTYSVLANATPNTPWSTGTPVAAYSFTYDLSSITGLNDQTSNIYFRLVDNSTVSANNATVAAAGTDRVDNFTVSGVAITAVPVPAAVWLFGSAIASVVATQRRRKAFAA